MQDEIEKKIKIFSSKIRKKILDLSFYAGSSSSHFGGALSSADIVATLFSSVMKFEANNYTRFYQDFTENKTNIIKV